MKLSLRLSRTSSSHGPDYWSGRIFDGRHKLLLEFEMGNEQFANLLSSREAFIDTTLIPRNVESALPVGREE
jgi:hypothetical protein